MFSTEAVRLLKAVGQASSKNVHYLRIVQDELNGISVANGQPCLHNGCSCLPCLSAPYRRALGDHRGLTSCSGPFVMRVPSVPSGFVVKTLMSPS